MTAEKTICVICAWRATCQKMFSMSGRDMKCADFVKDVSVGKEKEPGESEPDKD
jgi:hypothetical protein